VEYTPYGELWIEQRSEHMDQDGKTPFRFTGKEFDEETGFYYYGARYLNPKTSVWISADPAMGDYIPSAPVDDEARKRNGNLPGMGGVFNYVNMHVYHYAGNNPIKYIDPDGNENKQAMKFMKDHIVGRGSGYGYANDPHIPNSQWRRFEYGAENLPDSLLCIEAVWAAYKNTGAKDMPYGRSNAFDWFKEGGTVNANGKTLTKSLVTDIFKGEQGDVVFMGKFGDMEGHAVLLDSVTKIDSNTIEMKTVGAFSPNGKVGHETHIFKKNNKGEWINTTHGGYEYKFQAYGQFSE
jgi:RHS repeat-associated protein